MALFIYQIHVLSGVAKEGSPNTLDTSNIAKFFSHSQKFPDLIRRVELYKICDIQSIWKHTLATPLHVLLHENR